MAIKSLEELRNLRASLQGKIDLRSKGESVDDIIEILVGMGTCGIAAGARDTFNELLTIIETKEMHNVRVVSVGCMGSCFMEPIVQVSMPDRETILYGKMTKDKESELIQKVIVEKGYLSEDLIIQAFEKAAI